jgi:hypothetical protein
MELVDVVDKRDFYTRHGQNLNSRGKESMASKIAQTIENIMKKKADPISMKWYNDEVTNNQEHRHLDIQARPRSDSITTNIVRNVNIVTMTENLVMIKASDDDTVLDEKKMSVT